MHGGKLLVCRRSAGANNVFIAISAVKYTNWTKTRLTDTWIDSLPTLYMYEDMCNGNTNLKRSSRFRQKRETYQIQAVSHWQLIGILQLKYHFPSHDNKRMIILSITGVVSRYPAKQLLVEVCTVRESTHDWAPGPCHRPALHCSTLQTPAAPCSTPPPCS